MKNNLGLEKKEKKILEKSRKNQNLPIVGSSIHADWAFILLSSLLLLIGISIGAFLKYQNVLSKIEAKPEPEAIDEQLNFSEVKDLIDKLETKEKVLNKLR